MADGGLQSPSAVHLFIAQPHLKSEFHPRLLDQVGRANDLRTGILHGHPRNQHIKIRADPQGRLLFGFLVIALFLVQVFLGQLIQFFGQEDIVKGGGNILDDGLLTDFQLVVGCLQPNLGGPDGSFHLAEGINDLI